MSGSGPAGWRDGRLGEWPGRWRRRQQRGTGAASAGPAPYNLWMNPALTPDTRSSDLPTGLTVDEAVRIAEAVTAAHAESTRTV
jgi:hypothetical protein